MNLEKNKIIGFSIVFFITFLIYLYTMSPTVAFWDCGEFIAASFSLGVPHPPGTPLYILIGRIFSLIPIGTIAQRITFISAFSGALASAFMYLVMLQIFGFLKKRISYIMHLSAVTGSLVASFSYSVWFSSVEAEVYALSGFVMLFMIWLTLKWAKRFKSGSHKTWRWVLLILYVGTLSIGIHLQPILIMIGIFLFALWVTKGREEYRDILLGAIFLTELLLIAYLLIKIFIETDSIGKFLPFILIIFGVLFIYLAYKWAGKYSWSRIVMISLVTLLGLSSYFYLMVRASANPAINESDPRDVKGLWDVFSRKQYGENNPLNRRIAYPEMWNNNEDLGFNSVDGLVHDVRIYFKYFTWQFTPWARENLAAGMISLWVALLYLSLGILGLVRLYYGDRKLFLLLFLTFFLFSMGLVFYLNMRFLPSDPGYLKPHEVRERDYFFASAYQWWGMFAGFGLFWLLELFSVFAGGWNKWKKTIVTVVGFVLVLIPIMGNKYSRANRRGDFMADDYGYNILISCTKPGILFTNGDNDTFPLWFQQEVIGTRKFDPEADTGIIVANFSLLNTNWYVKQIYQQGIPIPIEEPFRQTSLEQQWVETFFDSEKDTSLIREFSTKDMNEIHIILDSLALSRGKENFVVYVIDNITPLPSNDGMLFPKDIAMRALICGSAEIHFTKELLLSSDEEFASYIGPKLKEDAEFSIFFSITCSPGNKAKFDPFMQQEGLAFRLVPTPERFDFQLTEDLLLNKFRFRGLMDSRFLNDDGTININSVRNSDEIVLDHSVFLDENALGLATSYASAFFRYGHTLSGFDDRDMLYKAIEFLRIGRAFGDFDPGPFSYQLASIYRKLDEDEKALTELKKTLPILNELAKSALNINDMTAYERYIRTASEFYSQMLILYLKTDRPENAKIMLDSIIITYPNHPTILSALFLIPYYMNDTTLADSALIKLISDPGSHSMILPWSEKIAIEDLKDSTVFIYIITKAIQMGVEDSLLYQKALELSIVKEE